MAPDSVVVYASDHPAAAEFDAAQPFPVVRHPTRTLLPTLPARRRVARVLRAHECESVWFGAAAPLGLMAASLRAAGARRLVATTHGHEVGWAALPGARAALRRIADGCDVITYLGEYTRSRLSPLVAGRAELARLTPGVDVAVFDPDIDSGPVRDRYGLGRRPCVVCVSRLVPRKGQDVLIDALARVRRSIPDVTLLIVGSGPYRERLERRAERRGVRGHVIFTGAVPNSQLPEHFAAGDVFAMPCRTRRRGLDVEGLGIVYLEASAVGLPVIAGNSGGAPDAVREGETGYVVDGRDAVEVADRLIELLADRAARDRLGLAGRAWVERDWTWERTTASLTDLLRGA